MSAWQAGMPSLCLFQPHACSSSSSLSSMILPRRHGEIYARARMFLHEDAIKADISRDIHMFHVYDRRWPLYLMRPCHACHSSAILCFQNSIMVRDNDIERSFCAPFRHSRPKQLERRPVNVRDSALCICQCLHGIWYDSVVVGGRWVIGISAAATSGGTRRGDRQARR